MSPRTLAVSIARNARAVNRFGSSASKTNALVSRTTMLGIPLLAGGRYHVADPAFPAQRSESATRRVLCVDLRHDARNHFAMHRDLKFLAFPDLGKILGQILSQLRDVDFGHEDGRFENYVHSYCTQWQSFSKAPLELHCH